MPNLLLSQYGRSSYMDPSLPLLPALSRADMGFFLIDLKWGGILLVSNSSL
jgi:hypothetical protein